MDEMNKEKENFFFLSLLIVLFFMFEYGQEYVTVNTC